MQEYDNADGKCECYKCERVYECNYAGRYQRLPRGMAKGALGLCPKLKEE